MTTRPRIPIVDVLGVHVGVLTPETLLEEVCSIIDEGAHTYVTFTGVHGVMESQRDQVLMSVFNGAGISAPDGMPMVWAGRWAGIPGGARCYGPDCMLDLCRLAAEKRWPIFLYGGKVGVAETLADNLMMKFPNLIVAGTLTPPFRALTEEEIEDEISTINESRARFVFVGLGAPKQERWMAERVSRLQANALFGVGAAFDFHTGLVRQAPLWVQRIGMEWFYRLCTEPRRLASRYLRNNPAFIARIVRRRPRRYIRDHEIPDIDRVSR